MLLHLLGKTANKKSKKIKNIKKNENLKFISSITKSKKSINGNINKV